jgi:hypothetical protein
MTGFHIDTSKIGKKTTGEQYVPSARIDWSRLHQAQYGELQEHAIGIDREALQRILQAEERKLERELDLRQAPMNAKEFNRLHNGEFKPRHTETYRVPDELRGINCRRPALDAFALRAFIDSTSPTTQPEKETMNKIAIHQEAQRTIELSTSVYYAHDKSIVIRQAIGQSTTFEPYKLAEFKSKLSMDNAAILQLAQLTVTDLIPAPKQTLEVQELQAGYAVLLQRGWGYVISVTESKDHPQDVTVRYIELDGTLRVETLAQETYTTAVLSFDDSIYGSPAFKKFVFEDVLRPMNVISNGNTNRALAVYRIVDKVEFLGEKRTTDLLNAELAAACYRTWE